MAVFVCYKMIIMLSSVDCALDVATNQQGRAHITPQCRHCKLIANSLMSKSTTVDNTQWYVRRTFQLKGPSSVCSPFFLMKDLVSLLKTGLPFGAGLQCSPLSSRTSVTVGGTDWVSVSPIIGLCQESNTLC